MLSQQFLKKPGVIFQDTGDEIVISGISGKFPSSDNVAELTQNLYNKVDMVDEDETRWKHRNPEIQRRSGKINGLEKFDASFFGTHNKQADSMDPQGRILLEVAYEAILDAGVTPKSLFGSRTGVFVGSSHCESENFWHYGKETKDGIGFAGNIRGMLANRISFFLRLHGPSLVVDTSCASSMYALDQ